MSVRGFDTDGRLKITPWRIIVFMAPLSVAMLFLILFIAGDFSNLPEVAAHTRWWIFLLVPFSLVVFYLLHGVRLQLALSDLGVGRKKVTDLARYILSGNLVNAMLPGMGGELVTAFFVRRFLAVPMPQYLAASAYTKVVALSVNVALAFLGLLIIPERRAATSSDGFSLAQLFNIALGGLIIVAALALLFPGLLSLAARAARRVFKVPADNVPAPGFKLLVHRSADGLDRTAVHFRAIRRGGLRPFLRVVGVCLLINVTFTSALVMGFIAVGYVPAFHEVLLFFSVQTLIRVAAMVFVASMGVTELTALAYWSQLTGLRPSEILVAMLSVKLWEVLEMATASVLLGRYVSRVPRGEFKALLRGQAVTDPEAPAAGAATP